MNQNFALIGAAGFVAPRHMQAIRDTGNQLVAATDPHDSVGILDSHFFNVAYFREFERFDRHIEKLRRSGNEPVQYVSICSPNYMHDAHVRFALRVGANAICEKPLVLNPWNCDALLEIEKETGKRVYTVLQLREHPVIQALKQKIAAESPAGKHEIDLTYVTARGLWYRYSWKGNAEQSGGLATNIGIHFFDMLIWIFGKAQGVEVKVSEPTRTGGILELERARVKWFLSVDPSDVPEEKRRRQRYSHRAVIIDGTELEFSEGFTHLHTRVYEDILAGHGNGIEHARPSIQLAYDIRKASGLASQ